MQMKRINAGKLRAIGYDSQLRCLRVELDDGSLIEYSGVGDEVWRRLSGSGSAWSYYRDKIEEEYSAHRVSAGSQSPAAIRQAPTRWMICLNPEPWQVNPRCSVY